MNIAPDTTISQLAAGYPATIPVLERHGLEYCCGGGRPLDAVCRDKGLDADAVWAEIESAIQGPRGMAAASWQTAPLSDLIEHIVTAYHRPHASELVRLERLAMKVASKHGDRFPEIFPRLVDLLRVLTEDLLPHMEQEERVVFPLIASIEAGRTVEPGRLEAMLPDLMSDHFKTADVLAGLREATSGFTPPDGVCPSFVGLYAGLEALEREVHRHVHLENHVLFPRAVDAELR